MPIAACLILFLLYLVAERILLRQAQRRIPIRIAITGTRGKSGVARLLAAVLKEDGRRVVVKTTGSEALIQMPDGKQISLDRSVGPSILEQKELVLRAARAGADCLIVEVMSLRPENHYVESRHLLRPNIVVITNVHRDHTEIMGETEEKIASVLSLDIVDRCAVFASAGAGERWFRKEAERFRAAWMPVVPGSSAHCCRDLPVRNPLEFTENLDLACAVAVHVGVPPKCIAEGIRKVRYDIGGLDIWRHPDHDLYLVNAFAANDPESTFQALEKAAAAVPARSGPVVGILNLRADRLPRTLQWIQVLQHSTRFHRLFVIGEFTGAIRRRLPEAFFIKAHAPDAIMNAVRAQTPEPAVIFGFGNIKGAGMTLIHHWKLTGRPYNPAGPLEDSAS